MPVGAGGIADPRLGRHDVHLQLLLHVKIAIYIDLHVYPSSPCSIICYLQGQRDSLLLSTCPTLEELAHTRTSAMFEHHPKSTIRPLVRRPRNPTARL
jgi:hypothetical protein